MMLVLSVAILCSQYEPNQPISYTTRDASGPFQQYLQRIKNAVKAWELGKKKNLSTKLKAERICVGRNGEKCGSDPRLGTLKLEVYWNDMF